MGDAARSVELSYRVPWSDPRWVLDDDEERMPESPLQGEIIDLLKLILRRWVARRGASALVGGNIALRWDPQAPSVGVDPDVYLVEPAPPMSLRDKSLRTWVAGHNAPRLVVEVVSDATADEDYGVKIEKYAASGARELWIFDPLRLGPSERAHRLQVWHRGELTWQRIYAGDGPARSPELDAWIVCVDDGLRLRVADDPFGERLWPTAEEDALTAREAERVAKEAERAAREAERAAREAERAAREAERAAKEEALAEVARLRAELAKLQG